MGSVNNIQSLNSQSIASQPAYETHMNNVVHHSRFHSSFKFVQTLLTTVTSTIELTGRLIKFITWDISKAGTLRVLGYHAGSTNFLQSQYLKTGRAARDILFIPTVARSAFNDIIAKREVFTDDLKADLPQSYLSTAHTKKFDLFSSFLHGRKTLEVIQPTGIQEFAAESDGDLKTVMASHFLKPGVMAINFGIPNLSTFATEAKEDGSVQTLKVDAKSLKREKMGYHPTNGKIQSGVFFVPTNLPAEALERFKAAAEKLQGRKDITCVNTNCRVLKEAGFSIEGKNMEDVVFPTTMMEHLLFRNVIFTDTQGRKHKVHFDIINTTQQTLEQHFEKIDLAVLGTRLRHHHRNADTEENKKARGLAAKALIAEEEKRLAQASSAELNAHSVDLTKRKIAVSVPSAMGDLVARIWGRHTIYEIDLSDKETEIALAFAGHAKLKPFPQAKPNFVTRLKRDIFFSKPMINFLRRHIMGRKDRLNLNTQDLFSHLKSTKGEHINYVLLDNKVVFAKVHANGQPVEARRKVADWALSKHALIAGRAHVHCSGEVWYDHAKERFIMNKDSGTYLPNEEHLEMTVQLANNIFRINSSNNAFEAATDA